MAIQLEIGEEFKLNDHSFRQLSRLCGVSADTLNRLSPKTAAIALGETLPSADRPIQFLSGQPTMRSIHGVNYTRLWNSELLDVVADYEPEFQPPKNALNGHGTGLYAGEQDMFAFLIDDNAWVDIGQNKFAPGFFVWNSEVGSRSLGIHGNEHYAQVTLVENSETRNRRLQRVEVYRHGRNPIVLRGENLPYFVYLCTDKDEKGERFMASA